MDNPINCVHVDKDLGPKKKMLKPELADYFIHFYLRRSPRDPMFTHVFPEEVQKLGLTSKTFRWQVLRFFAHYNVSAHVERAWLLLSLYHKTRIATEISMRLDSVEDINWLPLILARNVDWAINIQSNSMGFEGLKKVAVALKENFVSSYDIRLYAGTKVAGVMPFLDMLKGNIKEIQCGDAYFISHLDGFSLEGLTVCIKPDSYLSALKSIGAKNVCLISRCASFPLFYIDDVVPCIECLTFFFHLHLDPIPPLHDHMERIRRSFPNLKKMLVHFHVNLGEGQADKMATTVHEIHEALLRSNAITSMKVIIYVKEEDLQMLKDMFNKFFDFEPNERLRFALTSGSSALKVKLRLARF